MATYYWISTSSTDPTVGANWQKSDGTTGVVPANGDDVVLQGVPGLTLAGIGPSDQSAIALNSLTVRASFTAQVGSSSSASASFFGYWKIGAATWYIDGSGSSRLKFNGGATASTVTVASSGSSADSGQAAVRWVGTNAANVFYMTGGTAGVGTNLPGEAATLAIVGITGSQTALTLGGNTTLTTLNVTGGASLTSYAGATTLTVASGSSATLYGTAKVTTINNYGTVYPNNRPAANALNAYPGSTTDFSGGPGTATVAARTVYPDSVIKTFAANPGHITFTTTTLSGVGSTSYA